MKLIARAALVAAWAAALDSPNFAEAAEDSWFGCLTSPKPVVQALSTTVVRYCGALTSDGADALRALVNEETLTIEMLSIGGEFDGPLDVADAVYDSGAALSVIGPCLSGCASFVFVAAQRRTLKDGALLALHNTATSAQFMAERVFADEPDWQLLKRSRRESILYLHRNVDFALLFDPQAMIGTVCIADGGHHSETNEQIFLIKSEHSFWIPEAEHWRLYGVEFSGHLEFDVRHAFAAAERYFAGTPSDVTFIAGGTLPDWRDALDNVTQCSDR